MEEMNQQNTEAPPVTPQSSGGRGRGRRPKYEGGQPKYQTTGPRGAIEELKDNIYIVGDARQADKYNKTTEAILSYIQTNYTEGQDVVEGLTSMTDPNFNKWKPDKPKPTKKKAAKEDPPPDAEFDESDKQLYTLELKAWVERKGKYRTNMARAFGVLWGQCSMGVKNKIESRKDWTTIKASSNAIDLLKAIKEVTQDYQDNKYPLVSIKRAIQAVLTIKQDEREGLVVYTKQFRNAVDHMEAQQGKLPLTEYVVKMDGYRPAHHDDYTEGAYESFIALCYLEGCSKATFLMKDLANAYARDHDDYPKTLNAAISMVSSYMGNAKGRQHIDTSQRPKNKCQRLDSPRKENQ
jgi:hypothetical protein